MSIRRLTNLAGFLIAAGLLGFGYYLQFVRGMLPCPMCIFERIAIAALGLVFLVAFLHHPRKWGRFVYAVLIVLVAAVGIFVSARHVYIQHHPGEVMSCGGASLNDMIRHLPALEVVRQVLHGSGECAHVDTLFGVTLPLWVLIWMVILGIGGVWGNSRR